MVSLRKGFTVIKINYTDKDTTWSSSDGLETYGTDSITNNISTMFNMNNTDYYIEAHPSSIQLGNHSEYGQQAKTIAMFDNYVIVSDTRIYKIFFYKLQNNKWTHTYTFETSENGTNPQLGRKLYLQGNYFVATYIQIITQIHYQNYISYKVKN